MLTNSISSVVYWVSDSLMVKIRVSCYKKKAFNEMDHFYKEYKVYNENLHTNALAITLGYNYHLTLENTKNSTVDNISVYIPLDYAGIFKMVELFEIAVSWIRRDDIWVIQDKKLAILPENSNIKAGHYIGQYLVMLQPTLDRKNGVLEEAIILTIHDANRKELICSILNIDRVYGNLEFFRRVDPSILAQLLVNYMGIPEPGTNRMDMSPVQTQINRLEKSDTNGIMGRKLNNQF